MLAPLVDFEFSDSLASAPRNSQEDFEAEDQASLRAAEDQAKELVKQGSYSAAASERARAQNLVAARRKARASEPGRWAPGDHAETAARRAPCGCGRQG